MLKMLTPASPSFFRRAFALPSLIRNATGHRQSSSPNISVAPEDTDVDGAGARGRLHRSQPARDGGSARRRRRPSNAVAAASVVNLLAP